MSSVYQSSPIKRTRRTKAEIERLKCDLYAIVSTDRPMTVRQVFYRAVSAGIIQKREAEYKNVVVRLLADMRISGELPFDWIADNTRWQRKPLTFDSLESAVRRTAEAYRRSVWDVQDCYVEIWLEKDALAGVLYQVTRNWDVPLMVTRGYPSLSYLYEAAEYIGSLDKPAHIYYFGDYDPSGLDIYQNLKSRLREFAPDADISFERTAVTPEQIRHWGLSTRPTKRTDSRAKSFQGESVEVDAIEPVRLRELTESCIVRHIDEREHRILMHAEQNEREALKMWAGRIGA